MIVVDENYLTPSFEDRVRIFWDRYGRTVIAGLVLLVVFFAAKTLFGVYADYREKSVRSAYAEAGDDTAALSAFAAANPAAALSGVALVRVGDASYAASDYAAAAGAYAAAIPLLKSDPIGARARMGQAIALLQVKDEGARSMLESLANDTQFPAPLRAEAAYHLAVLTKNAGQTDEAARMLALAISVDTSGLWSQRASRLQQRMPVTEVKTTATQAPAPTAAEVPAVSFPGATK